MKVTLGQRINGPEGQHRGRRDQAPLWAFFAERTVTGLGGDTSIRMPHAGQYTVPAFSTTVGTVRNLR